MTATHSSIAKGLIASIPFSSFLSIFLDDGAPAFHGANCGCAQLLSILICLADNSPGGLESWKDVSPADWTDLDVIHFAYCLAKTCRPTDSSKFKGDSIKGSKFKGDKFWGLNGSQLRGMSREEFAERDAFHGLFFYDQFQRQIKVFDASTSGEINGKYSTGSLITTTSQNNGQQISLYSCTVVQW